MIRLVVVGAGGHAKVVLDNLRARGGFEIVGVLDRDSALWNMRVGGAPVLGGDEQLPRLLADGVRHAVVGVGGVGDNRPRQRLFEMLQRQGFELVAAVHPAACIAPSTVLGRGVAVMPGAIINAAAQVGDNAMLNTACVVEHDCRIGDHAHIAPAAVLAGGVRVGAGAHVGLGARIVQGMAIGARAIVGAGAVVLRDVPERAVVVGVPARILREVPE